MRTAISRWIDLGPDHGAGAVLTDRHNPVPFNIALPATEGKRKARNTRTTAIAASLPAALPRALDIDTAEAGARATRGQGLERAAFLVQVAAAPGNDESRATRVVPGWCGGGRRRRSLGSPSHPGTISAGPGGGREPLRSLHAGRLSGLLEGPVTPLDDELSEAASAPGALAVVLVSIDPGRQSDRSTVTEPAP
jgi:hypothetical protein